MGSGLAGAELQRLLNTLAHLGVVGPLSDGQLLSRVLGGEGEPTRAAFTVLVERHGPMVLRVCRQVLGDEHDADDAFQATFLVLARRARSVRKAESVASWLHGVARTVSLRARADAARRRAREQRGADSRSTGRPANGITSTFSACSTMRWTTSRLARGASGRTELSVTAAGGLAALAGRIAWPRRRRLAHSCISRCDFGIAQIRRSHENPPGGGTMRPKRRMRPGVDALESKLSLSSAPLAGATMPAVEAVHPGHRAPGAESVALHGQVSGTFTSSSGLADVGASQTLHGAGAVAPLGAVEVGGELHLPGFIRRGRTTGSFTLTNSAGSVTIHFAGAAHAGWGTLPHTTVGHFAITSGSGAYAAAAGSGRAILTETPERRPTPRPGGPTPDFIVAAMFTLTLEPAAGTRRS